MEALSSEAFEQWWIQRSSVLSSGNDYKMWIRRVLESYGIYWVTLSREELVVLGFDDSYLASCSYCDIVEYMWMDDFPHYEYCSRKCELLHKKKYIQRRNRGARRRLLRESYRLANPFVLTDW